MGLLIGRLQHDDASSNDNRYTLEAATGILHWIDRDNDRKIIAIPAALQRELLRAYHVSQLAGHFGRTRTIMRLKLKYHCPGMSTEVKRYPPAWVTCLRTKQHPNKRAGRFQSLILFHILPCVQLYYLSSFPETPRGNKYVLTIIDKFSK